MNTSLAKLAALINVEHQQAALSVRDALVHAGRCGEHLIAACDLCRHGEWLPWLATNCHVGVRQARRYMQVARGWKLIEANRSPGSDLTIKEAIALLADPDGEEDPGRDADLQRLSAEALAALSHEEQREVLDAEQRRIQERAAARQGPPRDPRTVRLGKGRRFLERGRRTLEGLGGEADRILELLRPVFTELANLEDCA